MRDKDLSIVVKPESCPQSSLPLSSCTSTVTPRKEEIYQREYGVTVTSASLSLINQGTWVITATAKCLWVDRTVLIQETQLRTQGNP